MKKTQSKVVFEIHKILQFQFCTLIIFIITSCANINENREIIKVDLDKPVQTNLNPSIKDTIKLETDTDCIIGEINRIEYFEDRLYILDKDYSKTLYVFDKNGKLLSKTRRGKGPGETIKPMSFTIDKRKKQVLLVDQGKDDIVTYNLDLNYLCRQTFKPRFIIRDIELLGEDTILAMNYNTSTKGRLLTSYSIITSNFSTSLIDFIYVEPSIEEQSIRKPISKGKRTLFIAPWNYNIYEIQKNKPNSVYLWDFDKYNLKESEQEKLTNNERWTMVHAGNSIGPFFNLIESENYISTSFRFKQETIIYFYSKEEKRAFQLNEFFHNKSLPNCIIGNVMENDTFIGIVETFGGNKKGHNPVLILFNLDE